MIKIKRGLDLPIIGAPQQRIKPGPKIRSVALVGLDYIGMKPTMAIQVGDHVKQGQLLFNDKKTAGVRYTAPATGTVSAIHRGDKRVLQSVVIDVDFTKEQSSNAITFARYDNLSSLNRQQVVDNLVESGLWTALRTRPFSKVPAPNAQPAAIFISVMDTRPLAADPIVVIAQQAQAFNDGLQVLQYLAPKIFVCQETNNSLATQIDGIIYQEFSGPHPAGLPGTHIHMLDPVSANKTVWTVGYQDVIAIGQLFTTGQLNNERVISLAGPQVDNPRLLTTCIGANLEELTAGQLKSNDGQAIDNRIVSGSVLGGRTAHGATAFLGRYHDQVTVLEEGLHREFMGWLSPGLRKHSVSPIYLSQFSPRKRFAFTTNTNGSERAMVPVGSYERVMPLDILPTQLLRALIVGDTQTAQALGCLELDEEDLALCTYVCPGKYEYGPILRDNLTRIENEG